MNGLADLANHQHIHRFVVSKRNRLTIFPDDRKGVQILWFEDGIVGRPETKAEFQTYYNSGTKKPLRQTIRTIQEIRNHDLIKLLFYSGEQYKIQAGFANEWTLISGWNPEIRYKIRSVRKTEAQAKLAAINALRNLHKSWFYCWTK